MKFNDKNMASAARRLTEWCNGRNLFNTNTLLALSDNIRGAHVALLPFTSRVGTASVSALREEYHKVGCWCPGVSRKRGSTLLLTEAEVKGSTETRAVLNSLSNGEASFGTLPAQTIDSYLKALEAACWYAQLFESWVGSNNLVWFRRRYSECLTYGMSGRKE